MNIDGGDGEEALGKGKVWFIVGQESLISPEALAYEDKLQLTGTLKSQGCVVTEGDHEESSWKGPWGVVASRYHIPSPPIRETNPTESEPGRINMDFVNID